MNIIGKLRGHLQEYVSRYTILAAAILTPVAGLLGAFAADLGGADSPAGRAVLAGAAAIGTAGTFLVFIRNMGVWQMLDEFGTAPNLFHPVNEGLLIHSEADSEFGEPFAGNVPPDEGDPGHPGS